MTELKALHKQMNHHQKYDNHSRSKHKVQCCTAQLCSVCTEWSHKSCLLIRKYFLHWLTTYDTCHISFSCGIVCHHFRTTFGTSSMFPNTIHSVCLILTDRNPWIAENLQACQKMSQTKIQEIAESEHSAAIENWTHAGHIHLFWATGALPLS